MAGLCIEEESEVGEYWVDSGGECCVKMTMIISGSLALVHYDRER